MLCLGSLVSESPFRSRVLFGSLGVIVALLVIAVMNLTWRPTCLEFCGGVAKVFRRELKICHITAEFGQPPRSPNKSIIVNSPSPKEQMLLPLGYLLQIGHRHFDLRRLKLATWSNNRFNQISLGERAKIHSLVGAGIAERKIDLAFQSFRRRAPAIVPEILDLHSGQEFAVWGGDSTPIWSCNINSSPLIRGIQVIGLFIGGVLESGNNCENPGKDCRPYGRAWESRFWFFIHVAFYGFLSVGTFVLTVTLLYNLQWVSNRKEILRLLLFVLLSVAVWSLATRQVIFLILLEHL